MIKKTEIKKYYIYLQYGASPAEMQYTHDENEILQSESCCYVEYTALFEAYKSKLLYEYDMEEEQVDNYLEKLFVEFFDLIRSEAWHFWYNSKEADRFCRSRIKMKAQKYAALEKKMATLTGPLKDFLDFIEEIHTSKELSPIKKDGLEPKRRYNKYIY